MQIQAIQYETFGGNAKKMSTKSGYSILVGGEKYVVGAHHESALNANTTPDAVSTQFRHVTTQATGNKLNMLA